ncbi:MAG: hypothetical protein AAB731_04925 [Patescibacteria group bacterium]
MGKVLFTVAIAMLCINCASKKPTKTNPTIIIVNNDCQAPEVKTGLNWDAFNIISTIRYNFEMTHLSCRAESKSALASSDWVSAYETIYDCHFQFERMKSEINETLGRARGPKPTAQQLINQVDGRIHAYLDAIDCFLDIHEYDKDKFDKGWKGTNHRQGKQCLNKLL